MTEQTEHDKPEVDFPGEVDPDAFGEMDVTYLPGDEPATDTEPDDEDDGLNAYDIPVTAVDAQFLTHVSEGEDAMTLGDAAEVAALNLIRVGLDGYRILYTDVPTGRQWIGEQGVFVALPPREGEGPDAPDTD